MLNKTFLFLLSFIFFCMAGQFSFTKDTIWEHDPYVDSGYPVQTFVKNISTDSVIIDSIDLIIDTIKYPKYQIDLRKPPNMVYHFGNIFILGSYFGNYYPFSMYKIKYPLLVINHGDSLKLWGFEIDKVLFFPTRDSKKRAPIARDSIVPITVSFIFYSKGYPDTLVLNGKYNYNLQISTSIKNTAAGKTIKKESLQGSSCFYTCSGRKVDLSKFFSKSGCGVYFSPSLNRKILKSGGTIIIQ